MFQRLNQAVIKLSTAGVFWQHSFLCSVVYRLVSSKKWARLKQIVREYHLCSGHIMWWTGRYLAALLAYTFRLLQKLWISVKSESKLRYDWRPVSQCVLVSSHFWFSWPDVSYCLAITVVAFWCALSDERSGLSFASLSLQNLVLCQCIFISYV
jgi:hypothetical protein